MAIGTYELWLDHWDGTRLAYLDSMLKLEYTRVLHGVGVINLTMPSSFDTSLLQDDYKIEVWRALPGVPKRLENVYMIRGWRKWTDETGVDKTLITGVDGNDILKRRIVYYQPQTAGARKTGYAGNILRAYIRGCIVKDASGTSVGKYSHAPARDDIATYFTVQADANDGIAAITESREWDVIFDVANDICDRSTGAGSDLWWYVYSISGAMYEFRCYAPLMGQDLTAQFVVSVDNALAEPVHEYDATEEMTYFAAVGGEDPYNPPWRMGYYAYKTARMQATPFNYREMAIETNSRWWNDYMPPTWDAAGSDEHAQSELLTAKFLEMETWRYGRDWDLGDKIILNYRDLQKEAVVKTVYMSVSNTEKVYSQFKIPTPFVVS